MDSGKKYREKMSEDHEQVTFWLKKQQLNDLLAEADKQGWINKTGRNAGQPSMGTSLSEIIKIGLETLRGQQGNDELTYRINRLAPEQQEVLKKLIEMLEKK